MTVETKFAVGKFMQRCRVKHLSPATLAAYEWCLGEFERAYPETLPETADDVEAYLDGLKRLAVRSRWNQWRTIRTFYTYCARRLKTENPAAEVEAPRVLKGNPKALSDVELRSLLALPLSRRDRALIVVLLNTGIRLGEIAGLGPQDVGDEVITVQGKSGRRSVPLSPAARQALIGVDLPWRGQRGGALTRSGVYQVVRDALRLAGVAHGGPHLLRHTFATQYIMRGGDPYSLQALMGHANPTSTFIYTTMTLPNLVRQHERYALFGSGAE